MDWNLVLTVLVVWLLLDVVSYFAWEKAAIKRAQKRADVRHKELASRLEDDSRDQVRRLAHAMKNHVEGPFHKR